MDSVTREVIVTFDRPLQPTTGNLAYWHLVMAKQDYTAATAPTAAGAVITWFHSLAHVFLNASNLIHYAAPPIPEFTGLTGEPVASFSTPFTII